MNGFVRPGDCSSRGRATIKMGFWRASAAFSTATIGTVAYPNVPSEFHGPICRTEGPNRFSKSLSSSSVRMIASICFVPRPTYAAVASRPRQRRQPDHTLRTTSLRSNGFASTSHAPRFRASAQSCSSASLDETTNAGAFGNPVQLLMLGVYVYDAEFLFGGFGEVCYLSIKRFIRTVM